MITFSSKTRLCAVIGNPIGHSLSPAIHNAAFNALDLDFVYLAFPVEEVRGVLEGMRAIENFRGLSVTIPHKTEVMKYVDEISDVDRCIGSINTVIHEKGKLIGVGTDGAGALKALVDNGVEVDGRNVLMLGAGGASRAISFTLAMKTRLAELTIMDVNETVLQGLKADLVAGTDAVIKTGAMTGLSAAMERADIIINCTPVGMHPKVDASLIPPEMFRPGQAVLDIVYNPLETKMLAEAKSRGLKVIPGVEMFVNQAVLQFELFSGAAAPVEVMRRVVMERLQS